MSIPLDRLYNFIDGLCNHDVLIYRFSPHGSKKPEHLVPLSDMHETWLGNMTAPPMICHDQEPLHYDLYAESNIKEHCDSMPGAPASKQMRKSMHLRGVLPYHLNAYDRVLLCHSEQNSSELEKYIDNGFVGVYWWCHGIIARDWFRFAQHDPLLKFDHRLIKHDFLIYNRAWGGTREYRLKFVDQLIESDLVTHCQTKFSAIDNQVHYTNHCWANTDFTVRRTDFEQHFPTNSVDSNASADYDSIDYQACGIEVVLETLFDDSRWHLTEKSLRPIACGKPFMLMATAGSLQYLRQYGFQTFDGLIDEQYDTIQNPADRLQAVVAEMQRISQLPTQQKQQLWTELNKISLYNQALFFSQAWHDSLVQELVDNLNQGLDIMAGARTAQYWKKLRETVKHPVDATFRNDQDVEDLIKWLNTEIPTKQITFYNQASSWRSRSNTASRCNTASDA